MAAVSAFLGPLQRWLFLRVLTNLFGLHVNCAFALGIVAHPGACQSAASSRDVRAPTSMAFTLPVYLSWQPMLTFGLLLSPQQFRTALRG
jgi:hypothetical protein